MPSGTRIPSIPLRGGAQNPHLSLPVLAGVLLPPQGFRKEQADTSPWWQGWAETKTDITEMLLLHASEHLRTSCRWHSGQQ